MNCPRPGCGGEAKLTTGGLITTHKLKHSWRTCAASGITPDEASKMPPPDSKIILKEE